MKNIPATDQHAERLTAACILSVIGGFLDIYTYLCRGNVFANAVTGNMVLFGSHLAHRQWMLSGKYLLAILFYALGIFTANLLNRTLPRSSRFTWHHGVIGLEFICLVVICLIPYGPFDVVVNAGISFVCALQVQTFRRVHGLPFASTMCTGNLRSGTDALFVGWQTGDRAEFHKALYYFGIIGCFVSGAAAGAILIHFFGASVIALAPLGLIVVFILITSRRAIAVWAIALRPLLRYRRNGFSRRK